MKGGGEGGVFETLGKLSILSNSICSILFNILLTTILKSVKRLFKIAGKSSVVESIFNNVTGETSY